MPINEDFIRNKWLPALRSGEWSQAQSFLAMQNPQQTNYCCLGVACQLLVTEGLALVKREHDIPEEPSVLSFTMADDPEGWNSGDLPTSVAEYLGVQNALDFMIPIDVGGDVHDETSPNIVKFNDELGYNFNQIADIIERELDANNIMRYGN